MSSNRQIVSSHRATGLRRRLAAIGGGFTLLELMLVIAIIMILAGMLMPALNVAKQRARDAATRARIKTLGDGAVQYSRENNDLYPGQWNMGNLQTVYGNVNAGRLFGSQALAVALFGLNGSAPSAADAKSLYADYREGDLVTISRGNPLPDVSCAIWDRCPGSAKAILYYPYIQSTGDRKYRGVPDANYSFAEEHNWYMTDVIPGTTAAPWKRGDGTAGFLQFFRDSATGKFAGNTFLLLAPAADRDYGTVDDIWNKD